MIIQNNFNNRDANPLNDYSGIGKGSHNIEKELELEKEGFIRENMENEVLENLRVDNTLPDDDSDSDGDNWKFFR